MPEEIDIWRSANVLVRRFGDAAPGHAARRIEELTAAGDTTGSAVWRRIRTAVEELLNQSPTGKGSQLH